MGKREREKEGGGRKGGGEGGKRNEREREEGGRGREGERERKKRIGGDQNILYLYQSICVVYHKLFAKGSSLIPRLLCMGLGMRLA